MIRRREEMVQLRLSHRLLEKVYNKGTVLHEIRDQSINCSADRDNS